jgi:lysylphosphatidylglycerol synthetase-like protein (DUF2156 family)
MIKKMMKKELEYEDENSTKRLLNDKKLTQFVNPYLMIVGGIILIIIGLYFHFAQYLPYTQGVDPRFIEYVNLFGVIIALEGLMVLLRGIIGNRLVEIHQGLMAFQIFISLASIYIGIMLYYNPEIIPFLIFSSDVGYFINIGFPFDISYLKLAIVVLIVLTIIGAINDAYKIGKLDKYK